MEPWAPPSVPVLHPGRGRCPNRAEGAVFQRESTRCSRANTADHSKLNLATLYERASIGVWVDPAVRKQLAQLALDTDKDQGDLMAEGLNLLFERYGKPPIAQVS